MEGLVSKTHWSPHHRSYAVQSFFFIIMTVLRPSRYISTLFRQPKRIAPAASSQSKGYSVVCFVKSWDIQTLFFWRWVKADGDGDGDFRALRDYALWIFYSLLGGKWKGHSEHVVSTERSHCSYRESFNESCPWNFSGTPDFMPARPHLLRFLLMGVPEIHVWQSMHYSRFKRSIRSEIAAISVEMLEDVMRNS